ncbi:MAG: site-2 protease family protein [Clostridia bacterium]|nr:site-2 protease family protein [Clostridia bacterium]
MNLGTFGTILIAVLVFGILIFIHEFGHYIFARIFKVTIEEFAIGMGPKLLWYTSKKTNITYSLRMIPIGGYVAMVGEEGESADPNSFDKKPTWQRLIITLAGAAVNIVAGFIAMSILTSMIYLFGTQIGGFYTEEESGYEISSEDSGLMVGDVITKVNGKRVSIYDELSYQVMRYGNEPCTLTIVRDGETMELLVVFPEATESGQEFGVLDIKPVPVDRNLGSIIKFSWRKSVLIVRMCWESIIDLITGRYTLDAVSGPVGISGAIGDAAKAGFPNLLYLTAMISINLGVMNLLPIPALDGGRIIFLLIELIARRRLPKKVEDTINSVGLLALLGLSVIIMIKDVFTIIF